MSRLLIISPGHPHIAGGVTDHTTRMAAAWRAVGHDVVVVGDPQVSPPAADGMLLQYVPFLYGRRGLSRTPERLLRAARGRGTHTVLFVHEPWVPPTRLPWLVLSPLQRRQLRRLIPLADVTVTAVPTWQSLLGSGVEVHYVGSTLGPPPETSTDATLGSPVVFSPFASGLNWDWIRAAVEKIGATPPLTVLGADAVTLATHPATRGADTASWDARGRLGPAETLAILATARLVLAPYVDGLTGRRTAAAATLSVGSRLVTSGGPLADPLLLAGAAGVGKSREEFARTTATLWHRKDDPEGRAQRLHWYQAHLDPTALDALMARYVLGRA